MQTDKTVVIKKGSLVTGVMVAGVSLILAGSGGSVLAAVCFATWVCSPYLVLGVISKLFERFTKIPGRHVIGCVFACITLGFTLLSYIGTLGDKSSTYGLIFIFVPLWLYVGGVGLYLLSILIAWLVDWSQRQALP